jgi:hypothetical protein
MPVLTTLGDIVPVQVPVGPEVIVVPLVVGVVPLSPVVALRLERVDLVLDCHPDRVVLTVVDRREVVDLVEIPDLVGGRVVPLDVVVEDVREGVESNPDEVRVHAAVDVGVVVVHACIVPDLCHLSRGWREKRQKNGAEGRIFPP